MAELIAPWLEAPRKRLAALRGRGAHALLLHGPAGAGKWQLAMSFAQAVLCEDVSQGGQACGRCDACRLFLSGNHPDLRVIVPDAWADRRPGGGEEAEESGEAGGEGGGNAKSKPSREIKIDQIRDALELFTLTAHRGGDRVIVLAPVEALNPAAANSLLKTLEEPPEGGLFVLVSDHLDRCQATIISRCAQLRVALPGRPDGLAWLQAQGMEASQAEQRLTLAGGAPLAALSGPPGLDEEQQGVLLGLLRRGRNLAAADIASEVPRTIAIAPAVALFQRWVWDFFSFRSGGGLRYHHQDGPIFEALSRHWSLQAAALWADRLISLRAVAEHPLNARAAIEGILLEYIASMDGNGTMADVPK